MPNEYDRRGPNRGARPQQGAARPYQVRQNVNQHHIPSGHYDPRTTQRVNSAQRSSNRAAGNYHRQQMIYAPCKRRKWPIILALLIIAVIVAAFAISCNAKAQEEQARQQAEQQAAEQAAQQQAEQQAQQQAQQEQQTAATDSELSPLRSAEERMATSTSSNKEKPGRKVCYLTFDDGPSTETPEILKILDEYGVHATWFVIGTRGHLEYVKDIWDAGHQVALHSYSHEYDEDYASVSSYYNGLDKLAEDVEKYLGFKPTLFRFPGGSVNGYNGSIREGLFDEAADRNWHYFDWNVSSGDAESNGVPAEKLVANIKKESEGNNSSCVLMHDTEAKSTTVDALPEIIEYYKSEGYTFDVLTADSYGYHF